VRHLISGVISRMLSIATRIGFLLLFSLALSGCSTYRLTNKQIYSVSKGEKAVVAIYMYGFADDMKKILGREVDRQHVEGTGIYSI